MKKLDSKQKKNPGNQNTDVVSHSTPKNVEEKMLNLPLQTSHKTEQN